MNADALIARLHGVRPNGAGKWMAKCPAHEDRGPSLSIKELADGTILLHDFGGCSPHDVLGAVGLQVRDLFPDRVEHHRGPARDRRHWHAAADALRMLKFEVLVVAIAAENVSSGKVLDAADRDRLVLAATRVRAAAEVCV